MANNNYKKKIDEIRICAKNNQTVAIFRICDLLERLLENNPQLAINNSPCDAVEKCV